MHIHTLHKYLYTHAHTHTHTCPHTHTHTGDFQAAPYAMPHGGYGEPRRPPQTAHVHMLDTSSEFRDSLHATPTSGSLRRAHHHHFAGMPDGAGGVYGDGECHVMPKT